MVKTGHWNFSGKAENICGGSCNRFSKSISQKTYELGLSVSCALTGERPCRRKSAAAPKKSVPQHFCFKEETKT